MSRTIEPIGVGRRIQTAPPRPLLVRTALAVALAGGFSAVAWLRFTPLARDTIWAEDGRTFLHGALTNPLWTELATPYAGYLHTVPRLLAALTVAVSPPAFYAQIITGLCCLVAGGVALVVFVFSRALVPAIGPRLALAAIVVLAPSLPREVLGNLANVHSILLWLLFWLLVGRAPTRAWGRVAGVAAFLAAATEVQSLFLLPLALLRIRDPRRRPTLIGLGVGATLQLVAVVVAPRAVTPLPEVPPLSVAYGFLINAVVTVWFPQTAVRSAIAWGGPLLALACAIPFVIAFVVLLRRRSHEFRILAGGALVVSAMVWVGSVVVNPRPFYDYASFDRTQLQSLWLVRYGVVPQMLLLAVLVVAITRIPAPTLRTVSAIALAVALILPIALQPSRRGAGPAWSPQIAAARIACADESGTHVELLKETITWVVPMTCAQIESRR